MACGRPEKSRLFCIPVFYGCYKVISKNSGNFATLFKKRNLQVLDNQPRHYPLCNASSRRVPDIDRNYVRKTYRTLYTMYYSHFKHIIRKSSCMRSGITIYYMKRKINYCSIRYDTMSVYLVCAPLDYRSAIVPFQILYMY